MNSDPTRGWHGAMELNSLTYTSRASPSLTAGDVDSIHRSALTYNPLDGITGLLVFNGIGFMQNIEGGESSIDDLVKRLLTDNRHSDFVIRDRRKIAGRFFYDWSMFRIDVDPDFATGLSQIDGSVTNRLDAPMMQVVSDALGLISRID